MKVFAGMVTRSLVVWPQLLTEALSFIPPMFIESVVLLYSSINSSLPPEGPRLRNSLITIELDGAWVFVAVGVSVNVGPPGVTVAVAVGVIVGVVVAPGGPMLKRMLFPAHMKLRRYTRRYQRHWYFRGRPSWGRSPHLEPSYRAYRNWRTKSSWRARQAL